MRTTLVLAAALAAACSAPADKPAEAPAAEPASASVPSAVGMWSGSAPAADAAERKVSLVLATSGEAEQTVEYVGKGTSTTKGTWSTSGADVTVTVSNEGGAAETVTYRFEGEQLKPVTWDSVAYGSAGPPALSRATP